MKIKWILGAALCLGVNGCSSPQTEVASMPTAKPTLKPTATPRPTPAPTLTPRQKRAEKRRKDRAKRAEQRRLSRVKREQEKAGQRRKADEKEIAEAAAAQRQATGDLLSSLDYKYVESSTEISNITNRAQQLLSDEGIEESTDTIMSAINEAMPRRLVDDNGTNHQVYAEYIAVYIVERKKGLSKDEIISGLRVLTDQ